MNNKIEIFKKGSKTFFYSSFFFPHKVKEEVATLYAFVRVADDFVDSVPALRDEFYDFKNKYYLALKGEKSNISVIDDFVSLQKKYEFSQDWVDAFLNTMESDLGIQKCENLKETEIYMYGSASVIGFMMCRILGIKEETHIYADKLGQAFQYINFIRDIKEDITLNRQYLPQENLQKYNLENLKEDYIKDNQENFTLFFREELDHFFRLTEEAKKGFILIPKTYRIPIVIATNLYIYIGKIIHSNPKVVYEKKVKPSKIRILYEALKVILTN
jgi:phytoene synthase